MLQSMRIYYSLHPNKQHSCPWKPGFLIPAKDNERKLVAFHCLTRMKNKPDRIWYHKFHPRFLHSNIQFPLLGILAYICSKIVT